MKLSIVVPVFTQGDEICTFVDSVDERARKIAEEHEIIVATNQCFEFVEKLHSHISKKAHIIAVRETDDYQQVVMAGVDRSDGDATIIMTPDYSPELMDDMVRDWRAGKDVVCLRRKHGKVGQFFTKLRLKIYNLFLFMFGDIFSIGILKDAQLLDKKIVDKMKVEQDLAHRLRTMYAPLDCDTAVYDIEHPIERFETKGTPKFDFWLGVSGAIVTLLALVTAFALAGAMAAPIWFWTIAVIFGLMFEFVFIALLVNATARVKIGILHNVDERGRIYNAAQEYFVDVSEEFSRTTPRVANERVSGKNKVAAPKKVVVYKDSVATTIIETDEAELEAPAAASRKKKLISASAKSAGKKTTKGTTATAAKTSQGATKLKTESATAARGEMGEAVETVARAAASKTATKGAAAKTTKTTTKSVAGKGTAAVKTKEVESVKSETEETAGTTAAHTKTVGSKTNSSVKTTTKTPKITKTTPAVKNEKVISKKAVAENNASDKSSKMSETTVKVSKNSKTGTVTKRTSIKVVKGERIESEKVTKTDKTTKVKK